MFQWRRFQFFDKRLVKDEHGDAHPLFQKLQITCVSGGRGSLVFGDEGGYVNLIDRDYNATAFPAHDQPVRLVQQLKQANLLLSVGQDPETMAPLLRIWNLDKDDKTGNPLCMKTIKLDLPKPHIPATFVRATEDLQQIAVGLCDGSVLLIYGDIVRERTPKQKMLRQPDDIPVTGLGWRDGKVKSSVLFVVSTASVCSYLFKDRSHFAHHAEELDQHGCELGCAVMSEEGDMVVGRNEAIYFYAPEGRGPCLAFEGPKKLMTYFRSHLVVVGADPHATVGTAGPVSGRQQKFNTINIYDMRNKFTAFSASFQNVSQVVTEWGSIFVLTADGKAYELVEKDTQTKLETLFKKNLYSVAINLAQSQQYDQTSIVDIYRKYGDHLYHKGDYDGAINQYLRTIGGLEPSYVIRKFLDAQRIHNLTSYLQALHEKNIANADHTTLLINCYTKLKDDEKLNQFIKTDSGYKFDIETAISVCRQAGYHDHALYLAEKHQEHDWYLKILLEDMKGYERALEYIQTLNFYEAEKNMKSYGKPLMGALPEKTTLLLEQLCTFYVPKTDGDGKRAAEAQKAVAAAADGVAALESILQDVSALENLETATTAKARPEEFIHIFVNESSWLERFLEFVIKEDKALSNNALIYTTLLELYLREDDRRFLSNKAAEMQESQQRQRYTKAMRLLQDQGAVFDEDHALMLCQSHNFKEGIIYLYESKKMYNEILSYFIEQNDNQEVVRTCKKFGDKEPNLWVQALSFFASRPDPSKVESEILEVLHYIDRDNLLPPLLVVQILARKPTATLAIVKDYIVRRLEHENQLINEEQRHIRLYTEDTQKMKKEIEDLRTSAKIFQLMKCSACTNALDLPAVHFLCMHSYHQRCLGENERECPGCAQSNRKIFEIKRSLEDNAGQHDQFFKHLEHSADGFSTIAEYFGRGMFRKVVLPSGEKEPQEVPPATITL